MARVQCDNAASNAQLAGVRTPAGRAALQENPLRSLRCNDPGEASLWGLGIIKTQSTTPACFILSVLNIRACVVTFLSFASSPTCPVDTSIVKMTGNVALLPNKKLNNIPRLWCSLLPSLWCARACQCLARQPAQEGGFAHERCPAKTARAEAGGRSGEAASAVQGQAAASQGAAYRRPRDHPRPQPGASEARRSCFHTRSGRGGERMQTQANSTCASQTDRVRAKAGGGEDRDTRSGLRTSRDLGKLKEEDSKGPSKEAACTSLRHRRGRNHKTAAPAADAGDLCRRGPGRADGCRNGRVYLQHRPCNRLPNTRV